MRMRSILFAFLVLLSSYGFSAESDYICAVYFSNVYCPNCAIADPYVLGKAPKELKNLVIIEYEVAKAPENQPVFLEKYVPNYNIYPGYPQVLFSKNNILLGRNDARKIVDVARTLGSNNCPLPDGSNIPFEELDISKLPGKPKIWFRNKVLIPGREEFDKNIVLNLLLSKDPKSYLQKAGINCIESKDKNVIIARGKIPFENACTFSDWKIYWDEVDEISVIGESEGLQFLVMLLIAFVVVAIATAFQRKKKSKKKLKKVRTRK